MCGAAPEDRCDRDAAPDREVRADAAQPPAECQSRPSSDGERTIPRHAAAVHGDVELRPADGDHSLIVELELGSNPRDFERGGVIKVANQRIGQPMGVGIHRSGDGHAS
jgi:hypothetical protein